jgi:acetylglutamate kinase
MKRYIDKAKTLIEALPYIREFRGITVVIKYGGSALLDKRVQETIMDDIALMKYVGFKPVVVHGGGRDITEMLGRLGIKTEFVDGLRVTDKATMEVVEMVLAGKLNKDIAMRLNTRGVSAVGVSGKDGRMLTTEKRPPIRGRDMGLNGTVKSVDTALIKTLIEHDFIPVISPVGSDGNGETHNVNADYAAVAVAGALNAQKLVFLTDVEGVRADASDSGTVISRITVGEVRRMVEDGTVSGGMIPKVLCCVAGIEAGVENVHILDGRVEHSLILEIFTKEGVGTLVEKG